MTKLTELIGIIKDKASQSKAALLSQRTTLSLLRATSHDSFTPPTQKHLHTLLSSADGSRATASSALVLLMDRLQSTNNSAVALKCLIAVHHITKRGTFILQDQISVFPATGGRNYLNLSNFRRHATDPVAWELSSWVRWFAQHIENLLYASRIIGFFIGNSPKDREERVSGLTNSNLLTEFESLVRVVEGICKRPDRAVSSTKGNKLVDEIVRLVSEDLGEIVGEVSVDVAEFGERMRLMGGLKFGEAVELVCCLKRLEECKERNIEDEDQDEDDKRLWNLVREVREKVTGMDVYKEEEGNNKVRKEGRKFRLCESDRFSGRVLNSDDRIRFPSGRLL